MSLSEIKAALKNKKKKKKTYSSQIDTMYKASQAYRGWGLSDWWNNRYVTLSCKDIDKECEKTSVAYTSRKEQKSGYPLIVFCGAFFDKLDSHSERLDKIKADKSLQVNVANLRSQGEMPLLEGTKGLDS